MFNIQFKVLICDNSKDRAETWTAFAQLQFVPSRDMRLRKKSGLETFYIEQIIWQGGNDFMVQLDDIDLEDKQIDWKTWLEENSPMVAWFQIDPS